MEPTDSLDPANSPAMQSQPSALMSIFIGPQGLRAGWRFAIYVAAFWVLASALSYITQPVVDGLTPLWGFLVVECRRLSAAVLPALALSRIENRPFGVYGLPPQQALGKNFWLGAIWGLAAITALLSMLRVVGVFYFGQIVVHNPWRGLRFAAFWGVLFVVVGLFEDFAFRGYSQFTLAQGIRFWPAAVVLSIAFGAVHFPQEYMLGDKVGAWLGALGAALIGLFFCLTLRRTGSLWFAVGMHAAWDWGESFLYSVPDSGAMAPGHLMNSSFHGPRWLTGGGVGPEGSVLLFVVIALLWIVFDRAYPARATS